MKSLKLVLLIIFFILYGIYYFLNNLYIKNQVDLELKNSNKDLKLHYEITSYHYKESADALFNAFRQNDEVIDILTASLAASNKEKEQLRQRLYKIIEPTFTSMKNRGLKILQFSTIDNKSFLRMHKNSSFGDDLSGVRPSIVRVNKTKMTLSGFEQGKYSHAFRHLYPVFNRKGIYLGAIDFGFSSEHMQKTLDDINKIHSHFLVKKTILDHNVLNKNNIKYLFKQSIEHRDFLIAEIQEVNHVKQKISKWTINQNKELIEQKVKEGVAFTIYGQNYGDLIVISFLPIMSATDNKEVSAYIVSYTTSPQIVNILKTNNLINLLFFVLLVSIFYFIYKQVSHKKELRSEVQIKTKELKELNESLEEKIELETLKNRKKDEQLYEHAKNAQMGEMIGNIAHQWRQPLSVISTISSGLKMNIEFDLFTKEKAIEDLENLNKTAQHLSETINIFRDYIKSNNDLEVVTLQERIDYSLSIVESSIVSHHIKLIKNIDYDLPLKVEIILGQLSQVLINILNNAKDVLVERQIEDKEITISVYEKESKAVILIEDNGEGIEQKNLAKIFDPYFTTKHQSRGTGIGLYMSKQIIEKHLYGKLYAKNTQKGAQFYIELPLN